MVWLYRSMERLFRGQSMFLCWQGVLLACHPSNTTISRDSGSQWQNFTVVSPCEYQVRVAQKYFSYACKYAPLLWKKCSSELSVLLQSGCKFKASMSWSYLIFSRNLATGQQISIYIPDFLALSMSVSFSLVLQMVLFSTKMQCSHFVSTTFWLIFLEN
jgi:hypothetical protein